MGTCACNPSTWEEKVGDLGYSFNYHNKIKDSLSYIRPG